ncbi:MAG: ABC transporter permease, partial [Gemmatimonadaceae bacterium]
VVGAVSRGAGAVKKVAAKASIAMPGATPPPMPGATPPSMPGATPPPMPGATPPSMPGATPPSMPGAERPVAATAKRVPASSGGAGSPGGAESKERGAEQATVARATANAREGEETQRTATAKRESPKAASAEASVGLHDDDQITAFFVGTKNRFEALQLQREMNTDFTEPLTAVIPGVALGELFNSIGSAEVGLRVVALFAVAIGLTGMLVALYSSLDARRREMAILRSVGAGPGTIVALLVIESGLLALLGCVIGVVLVYVGLYVGQGPIEQKFGLHIPIGALQWPEYQYLALILFAGIAVGFVPAFKAYRTSLADGLSPRA